MRILIYEYLSAKKNINQNDPMINMGLSMRNSVEKDLVKSKDYTIIIGKHGPEEHFKDYLSKIKSHIDAVWVIAPESNNTLLKIKDIFFDRIWIGCENSAIKMASSKTQTKKKLLESSILNPDSYQRNTPFGGYILKPDDGAGSEGTKKFASLKQAIFEKDKLNKTEKKYIIERFICGQVMSFSMLCYKKNTELLIINNQIIKISDSGKINYIKNQLPNKKLIVSLEPKIKNLAKKIKKAMPGLMGFVGVDFVLDEKNNIFILEVNPRLTCSFIGLSKYLNRCLSEEILQIFIKK